MGEFAEGAAQLAQALPADGARLVEADARLGGQQVDQHHPVGAGIAQRYPGDQITEYRPQAGGQRQRQPGDQADQPP